MVREKEQDGSSHVATELGSSNNDVVLELWTGMLAEFLRVYPSAVGSLHSITDIKLSLPKCSVCKERKRERAKIRKRDRKRENNVYAVLGAKSIHFHSWNLTRS